MAADLRHKHAQRLRLGHPSRMIPETRQVTLLVLGHLLVFIAAMSHDEIVAGLASDGWFLALYAERFELVVGLALFLCWSVLTLRLVAVVQKGVSREAAPRDGDDGKGADQ
ncbi:hypothetical protein DDZ14_06750 [Maritimibacter sp. 55A14]|uniref:hypothetical protein n=1 Tax=Maritimibacter sp. 55A14 TaxID=2174844 RepID=UPI000D619DE2|nr:hypothetical protein [Maritimibacter sp. 55A14]PWE33109.1 hypothetical protein DDZ14_06750 [Maritimibacter sp. 55A14]